MFVLSTLIAAVLVMHCLLSRRQATLAIAARRRATDALVTHLAIGNSGGFFEVNFTPMNGMVVVRKEKNGTSPVFTDGGDVEKCLHEQVSVPN